MREGSSGKAVAALLAAAAAVGIGLFLWGRRRALEGEESVEAEVEAHPS
jgi:uncharacterized protein HemX